MAARVLRRPAPRTVGLSAVATQPTPACPPFQADNFSYHSQRYRSGEAFDRQPVASVAERSMRETIQGTPTWHEESEDGLPKIVTVEGKE